MPSRESKDGIVKSDNWTMQFALETQLMIKAASVNGGLSRDAVMGLGSSARGLDESKPRLEDVTAKIELREKSIANNCAS